MRQWTHEPAHQLAKAVRNGEVTARQVAEQQPDRGEDQHGATIAGQLLGSCHQPVALGIQGAKCRNTFQQIFDFAKLCTRFLRRLRQR